MGSDLNHSQFLISLLICSSGYIDSDSDVSLEQDLAARRYRALAPLDDYDPEDY